MLATPPPCSIPVEKIQKLPSNAYTPNAYCSLQIFMYVNVDTAAVWAPSPSTMLGGWCTITSNKTSSYDVTIFLFVLSELYAKRNIKKKKHGVSPKQIISVTQNASKRQNVCSLFLIGDSVVCLLYCLKLIGINFSIAAYAFCFLSVLCYCILH